MSGTMKAMLPRDLAAQRACGAVGPVVELADRIVHSLAEQGIDILLAGQNTGDGRGRHLGEARDITNRRRHGSSPGGRETDFRKYTVKRCLNRRSWEDDFSFVSVLLSRAHCQPLTGSLRNPTRPNPAPACLVDEGSTGAMPVAPPTDLPYHAARAHSDCQC